MNDNKKVPAIRFAGFSEEWEERKLKEVAPLQRGFDLPVSEMQEGLYPVVMSNGIGAYHSKYKAKAPGVITGRSGTIGNLTFIDVDYWPHNTALWVTDFKGNNPQFVFYLYQKVDLKRFGTGSGVPTLNRNDVHDIAESIPTFSEQKKITDLFSTLDRLITLHQREYTKTINIKKAMLEKMFPKDGEDKPEIRFEGFSEAWERRKHDTVFDPIPNNTLSRADLNYDSGKVKSIHYGDILIKYGAITDCKVDKIPFITSGNVADYNSHLLCDGDVLFADTAEDDTVGKVTEVAGIGDNYVVSGLHTMAYRPKVKMSSYYLGYYLNSPSFHHQLLPLMQGIKVLSISRSNLAKTTILYPLSGREQAQIGSMFTNIDRLITLHQRELTKLQNVKKSLLEKMFV
jgi:type I restriction enzyme S subunit